MYLPDPVVTPARPLHRLLAGAAGGLVLLAWFFVLNRESALLEANLYRLLGALLAGGIAWATYRHRHGRRREGLPWQRCLVAGLAGSLAVTATSLLAPALGEFRMAGWLVSGVAGGAVVVLGGYALRGESRGLVIRGHRRDGASPWRAPRVR